MKTMEIISIILAYIFGIWYLIDFLCHIFFGLESPIEPYRIFTMFVLAEVFYVSAIVERYAKDYDITPKNRNK